MKRMDILRRNTRDFVEKQEKLNEKISENFL